MPKVSVIMPCYNHGAYLNEALDSVFAQTYKDFEVILIDDGSTDSETRKIIDDFSRENVKLIKSEHLGAHGIRNMAIKEAKGEYILPVDADDKISPHFLEKTVPIIESDKNIGIVAVKVEYFGEKTGPAKFHPYSFPEILLENRLVVTSLFRKEDWEKVGGFNTNITYGLEDWDFWLSIIEFGRKVVQLDEYLFFYRQKPKSKDPQVHSIEYVYNDKNREKLTALQVLKNHKRLYEENLEYILSAFYDQKNELRYYVEALKNLENKVKPVKKLYKFVKKILGE